MPYLQVPVRNGSVLLSMDIAGTPPSSVTKTLSLAPARLSVSFRCLANTPPGVGWQVTTFAVVPFRYQLLAVYPPFLSLALRISSLVRLVELNSPLDTLLTSSS